MSSKRTIRDDTKRSDRLGSLTLKDLVNDSEHWNLTGDYTLIGPYFEQTNPENKDEFGELTLNDRVNVVEYTDDDGIPRTHVNLYDLLADYVRDQNDFLVFVGLLQEIFDDIKSVADVFDTLADVDSVVEMFLPKLAYLLNYKYRYDIPDYVNRDIIRRLLWLYEQKATDKDVLDAADYATNDKWVGSTLFLPDAHPNERFSSIEYPVFSLFTHNISGFDKSDRYPDSGRYRGGVIILKVKKLDSRTREAVRRVLPAGLKCYYDQIGEFGEGGGLNGTVDFGAYYEVYEDTFLDQALIIVDKETQGFDGDYRLKHYFSGKQLIFCDNLIYYLVGVSWIPRLVGDDEGSNDGSVDHDIFDEDVPSPELHRIYNGFKIFSTKGAFSGKLRLEGDSNIQWVQTPIYPVKPNDVYYPVNVIEELVVNPWLDDSRYHQPFIGNSRYAMNSFWDNPDNFQPLDWVDLGDNRVAQFNEIESIDKYFENGLLNRSYSNNFYLEDYNEPIEFFEDHRYDISMGVQSYALPEKLPLDHNIYRQLNIDKTVVSDVFDGRLEYGHIFDGRGIDRLEIELLLIKDPKLLIELIFDHEETDSTVFDGDDTIPGEVRSGLEYFWTFPFELDRSSQINLELIIRDVEELTTKFDEVDEILGEVRSGTGWDYTYPFEVLFNVPYRLLEMYFETEIDSTVFDGPDTDAGEIRSGAAIDVSNPIERTIVEEFSDIVLPDVENFDESEIIFDTFSSSDIRDELYFDFQEFAEAMIVMILDHEELSSDTFDGKSTYNGDVRSGLGIFDNDPINVKIFEKEN